MREGSRREDARAALREARLSGRLGAEPIAELEHVLSHRRLKLRIFRALACRALEGSEARHTLPEDLASVGSSALTRKILGLLYPSLGAPRTLRLPGIDVPPTEDP
jgi:hypothetical protein